MTDVRAYLRHLRVAPRKVRLVIDMIRGLGVEDAERQLQFSPKHASLPVLKLLQSAKANAKNNFHLDPKNLIIKTITADGGPVLKRYRPRAFGSAAPILKRSTHITIILAERTMLAKATVVQKKNQDRVAKGAASTEGKKTEKSQPASTKTRGTKTSREKKSKLTEKKA